MATSIRVEMHRQGAVILLKSPGVQADLYERAQRIAAAAGPNDHQVYTAVGKTRSRVTVVTDTHKARRAEATDRNLTRAIDAARG